MSRTRSLVAVVSSTITSLVLSNLVHEAFHLIFSRGVRSLCLLGFDATHPWLVLGWVYADYSSPWLDAGGWLTAFSTGLCLILVFVFAHILARD